MNSILSNFQHFRVQIRIELNILMMLLELLEWMSIKEVPSYSRDTCLSNWLFFFFFFLVCEVSQI